MPTKHIKIAADLQTKHEDITNGFLEQALHKTEKAVPFVQTAKTLQSALQSVAKIDDLINNIEIREYLIAACGFSDKAKTKLTEAELNESIKKVLNNIKKMAGDDFRDEVLYRYLLTRGDTLGGSMRNLTGASAGIKLTNAIVEKLQSSGKDTSISNTDTGKVRRIAWDRRVLRFDVKPKIFNNNIDVVLLKTSEENNESKDKTLLENKSSYVACGELKGGIDPAGADEHWKTANSALSRIREAFNEHRPSLFFIGSAIEASMAGEIFVQLSDGRLTHAANLNDEDQFDDIVNWLISL